MFTCTVKRQLLEHSIRAFIDPPQLAYFRVMLYSLCTILGVIVTSGSVGTQLG